jgi:hypothetical protein
VRILDDRPVELEGHHPSIGAGVRRGIARRLARREPPVRVSGRIRLEQQVDALDLGAQNADPAMQQGLGRELQLRATDRTMSGREPPSMFAEDDVVGAHGDGRTRH